MEQHSTPRPSEHSANALQHRSEIILDDLELQTLKEVCQAQEALLRELSGWTAGEITQEMLTDLLDRIPNSSNALYASIKAKNMTGRFLSSNCAYSAHAHTGSEENIAGISPSPPSGLSARTLLESKEHQMASSLETCLDFVPSPTSSECAAWGEEPDSSFETPEKNVSDFFCKLYGINAHNPPISFILSPQYGDIPASPLQTYSRAAQCCSQCEILLPHNPDSCTL
jgi:hypothetical protein